MPWVVIGKYLLGPVGAIAGGLAAVGLLFLWLNAKADLRSANHQVALLNDSIHGGEPGYAIKQPGYIVRMAALQTSLNIESANTIRLKAAIEMQNAEVEKWKSEADMRTLALKAAQAGMAARAKQAAALSAQIAAIKPSSVDDAANFAKQSVDALVGGLQ